MAEIALRQNSDRKLKFRPARKVIIFGWAGAQVTTAIIATPNNWKKKTHETLSLPTSEWLKTTRQRMMSQWKSVITSAAIRVQKDGEVEISRRLDEPKEALPTHHRHKKANGVGQP